MDPGSPAAEPLPTLEGLLVRTEITLDGPCIPPVVPCGDPGPDGISLRDQLAVTVDDIGGLSPGDMGEEFRLQDMDPCKSQPPGPGCRGNIQDVEVPVDADLVEGAPVMKDQGGQAVPLLMRPEGCTQIDVGQDIAVNDDKGPWVPEALGVFDAPARPQDARFHHDVDIHPKGPAAIQMRQHLPVQVVGVYDQGIHAVCSQVMDDLVDHGPIAYRHEGLGSFQGQRPQACPEAGCEYHCLHDVFRCI